MRTHVAEVCLLAALGLLTRGASAGVPSVQDLLITDVGPRSFSVIWTASEPSTADLEVFRDGAGAVPEGGAVVTAHPTGSGDPRIRQAAESRGVMKVRVTGLVPQTTYHFRAVTRSRGTGDVSFHPTDGPLPAVTTRKAVRRASRLGAQLKVFTNDVLVQPCLLADGVTPAAGALLVASVGGGESPITSFAGDGVELPYALVDLNNLSDRGSGETLDLTGGEGVVLFTYRGLTGHSASTHRVPADASQGAITSPGPGLGAGWNFVSLPLEPGDPGASSVLGPIRDRVSSVWSYSPEGWRSEPPELHALRAYWVLAREEASLTVHGTFPRGSPTLQPGWNAVGSPFPRALGALEAGARLGKALDAVWSHDHLGDRWRRFQLGAPAFLNDLQAIEPGKGYWFLMHAAAEWPQPDQP